LMEGVYSQNALHREWCGCTKLRTSRYSIVRFGMGAARLTWPGPRNGPLLRSWPNSCSCPIVRPPVTEKAPTARGALAVGIGLTVRKRNTKTKGIEEQFWQL